MTLIRWNPMQHEIDRMFEFFRGGVQGENGDALFMPVVDIVEKKNDFSVRIELPGVKKEDVRITVQNGTLTVRGEKKEEKFEEGEGYRRSERSYGTFQRSFTLPTSIPSEKIDASYEAGVLTLTIPKAEESKPKEISVK